MKEILETRTYTKGQRVIPVTFYQVDAGVEASIVFGSGRDEQTILGPKPTQFEMEQEVVKNLPIILANNRPAA